MAYGKMANRYMSASDLEGRLDGTICRWKNQPVYVRVDGSSKLTLFDPSTMTAMGTSVAQIRPDDPEFDISSPEMGYLNYETQRTKVCAVRYAMRIPYRKFKQGINEQCVTFRTINNHDQYEHGLIYTKGFCDMLTETYPTLGDAMNMLDRHETTEVAVSQAIALQRIESGLTLVFLRGKNVGWILPNKKVVALKQTEYAWTYRRTLEQLGWGVE